MPEDNLLNQAQYIFTTVRLIRGHVLKIHANRVKKDIAGSKQQELTMTQRIAVMMIDERGPLTIKALADMLGISSPSASAMVDKLVSKGILSREQSREDRRKVKVSISPAAAKSIESVKQIALGAYVDLIKRVGPQTTRKWCDVLEELKRVIEKDANEMG